ncbi:MAG: protein-glutamate O-methyltransferase CheR [Nitrospirae bacterium]|nr:protein-glutamate O-methyltransferase CheR [Nitrospirota bacterium]
MNLEKTKILNPETFVALRQLIYERSGIFFPDNKKYLLESRLAKRVEEGEFETFENYVYFLRFDAMREKELSQIFDVITTNETSFFRDANQIQSFETGVLPLAIKGNGNRGVKRLKVWSAACSTGEEPYTIAMILMEKFPQLQGWEVEILASDISEGVLNAARKGEYGAYAIRNMPPLYLQKYFIPAGGRYVVKPAVKNLVRFSNINLYDSSRTRMIRAVDLIFCRNVLIYFDEEAKKKIISSLYDALSPEGYLLIGHSESLYNISRAFKLIQVGNALVYQKQ